MSTATTVRPALVARPAGRPAGEALADALEIILARDAQDGVGGLALLVWAEALRSPGLAAQFRDLFARLRAGSTSPSSRYPSAACGDSVSRS